MTQELKREQSLAERRNWPQGVILGQRMDRPIGDFVVLEIVKGANPWHTSEAKLQEVMETHRKVTDFNQNPIYKAVWFQPTTMPDWD